MMEKTFKCPKCGCGELILLQDTFVCLSCNEEWTQEELTYDEELPRKNIPCVCPACGSKNFYGAGISKLPDSDLYLVIMECDDCGAVTTYEEKDEYGPLCEEEMVNNYCETDVNITLEAIKNIETYEDNCATEGVTCEDNCATEGVTCEDNCQAEVSAKFGALGATKKWYENMVKVLTEENHRLRLLVEILLDKIDGREK